MTRIHRGFALLLAGLISLSLSACSAGSGVAGGLRDERPLVLATFTVIADMARTVAGDHLRVESIVKVGAEIHDYEPTPSDIAKASQADLIMENGLHLEAWFEQFIERVDVPHVTVSEGVRPIMIADGAEANSPNPHAWMSPREATTYVNRIADAFSALDPPHAADFAANARAYISQLKQVHRDLVLRIADLAAEKRALVTCEGAFSYLARDSGLTEHFLWPVNSGQQATPRQIARVIDVVRQQGIPAVFCESTASDASMRQVAAETDAVFGGTLYVDSLSESDGPVPTYLDLIRHDANEIARALTGTRT